MKAALLAAALLLAPRQTADGCQPCKPSCVDDFICCCGECVSKFQGCKPKGTAR